MASAKNSLVANINRRKKAGTSRPAARSTVSASAYENMQQGWPSKGRAAKKTKSKAKTRAKTKTKAKARSKAKKATRKR